MTIVDKQVFEKEKKQCPMAVLNRLIMHGDQRSIEDNLDLVERIYRKYNSSKIEKFIQGLVHIMIFEKSEIIKNNASFVLRHVAHSYAQ